MITFCLVVYIILVVRFWWTHLMHDEAMAYNLAAFIMHNLWSLFLFAMGIGAMWKLYNIHLTVG